jgi:hypothetical protein
VLFGKVAEGEDLGGGVGEVAGGLREPLGQLIDDALMLGGDLVGVGLGEVRAHLGRHQSLRRLGQPGEEVAEVMHLMPMSA